MSMPPSRNAATKASLRLFCRDTPSALLSHRLRRINIRVMAWTLGLLALLGVVLMSALLIASLLADTRLRLHLIQDNLTAPLSFQDERAASAVLATLALVPTVRYAEVYDARGQSTARYVRSTLLLTQEQVSRQPDGLHIELSRLLCFSAIVFDRQRMGTIVLSMDLAPYYRQLLQILLVTLFVIPLAIFLAMRKQSTLIASVTEPLAELAQRINQISYGNQYPDTVIAPCAVMEIDRLNQGFLRMVDEIRKRDHELARQVDTLEIQVMHRTAELELSRDAAVAGSRAKSEFLATMSHEIRTPMNGVLGMTELLQQSALDETQKYYLDAVEQSGRHLLNIINDILDFSKIESGHLELDAIDVNLVDLIEDTATMFAQQIQAKGLELRVDLPPGTMLMVHTDPLRLRQILANLLSNALKFTATGDITIRLQVRERQNARIRFSLTVIDTGVGIDTAVQEVIFAQFAQADGSTARKFGGTGLGLTISRMLARMLGGDIDVTSVPGHGASFEVTLTVPEVLMHPPRSDPPFAPGQHVLLMEQNPANRTVLTACLQYWGLTVHWSDNAPHALALLQMARLQDRPLQLGILGSDLADRDGLTVANRLRAAPGYPHLPLLLLSPAHSLLNTRTSLTLPMTGHLAKPVRQSVLYQALARALQPLAAPQPPAAPLLLPARTTALAWKGRVLLAEDIEVNQKLAMAWLLKLGVDVVVASNGHEAVAHMRESIFDLVLMDCHMPDMDGFEATREIRRQEQQHALVRTPIVALTANAMGGDREKCLAADMDDYLAKPYSGAQLGVVLARWLQPS